MQRSNFVTQPDRTIEKKSLNATSSSRTSTAKRPNSREQYNQSNIPRDNAIGHPKIINSHKNQQNGYSAIAHSRKLSFQPRGYEQEKGNPNDPYREILSYFEDSPEQPKLRSRLSKSPKIRSIKANNMQNMPQPINPEEFYAAGASRYFANRLDQRDFGEGEKYGPERLHNSKSRFRSSREQSPNSIMGIYVGNSNGVQKNNYMFTSVEEENEISHRFEEFMQKLQLDKDKFYHQLDVNVKRASALNHQLNPFVAPTKQGASKNSLLNLSIEEIVNRSINNRSTTPDITITERSGDLLKSNRNISVNDTRIRDQTDLFTNRVMDNSYLDNDGGYRAEPISNYSTLQHGTEDPNMPKAGFSPFSTTMKPENYRAKEVSKESGIASASSDLDIEVMYLKKEIAMNENKLKDRDRQISELKEKLREVTERVQSSQSDTFKLKFEIEKIGSEKRQLEQDFEASKTLSARLQKSLDEYEIQIARFKAQSDVGSRNIVEKEENLRKQIDVLNQELKVLRESNETLKKSQLESQGTSSISKQLNESADLKLKQSTAREEELKKQVDLMKQTIDAKIKEINLLKQVPQDGGAAQQELQKLKSEFSALATENEKSKGIIKDLTEQITNLNLRVKEAQEKSNTIDMQSTEQINAVNAKLNEAQARIKMFEAQSNEGAASLNAKLAEAQEKLKRTESQSNEQISQLSTKLNEAQSKIKLLEAKPNDQVAMLNAQLNEYQSKIKQLESQSNQYSIMTMKLEEAQARIKGLEAQLQEAQVQVQKAQTFQYDHVPVGDEAKLRFEYQRLEREMGMLVPKFESMQKELQEAQDKIAKSQNQAELEKEVESQQNLIIEMSNKIMTLQSEKAESEKKYTAILNDPSKVSDKEKAARAQADQFKNENKKLTDAKNDLEKKLANLQKDSEKKIAQEQKNNLDLKNQITKITAKDKGAAAAEEYRLMSEKLTMELNALKEQHQKYMEDSKQKFSAMAEENGKLKNELEEKTKKLNGFKASDEATHALAARMKETMALKAEIEKLKSQGGGGGGTEQKTSQQPENAEAAEDLERFKKLAEDQKALLKKFQTEHKNLNEKLSNKENENDELAEKLAEKETSLQKLQTDLARYISQIGELQMREQEYIAKLNKK